jgi:hypothetical protein
MASDAGDLSATQTRYDRAPFRGPFSQPPPPPGRYQVVRAIILNSVQSRPVHADDPWLRPTLQAADQLASRGYQVIASVGSAPWELVLWRAALNRSPLHVILPLPLHAHPGRALSTLVDHFDIPPDLLSSTILPSRLPSGRCKDTWPTRDDLAWAMADVVVPISIRPAGVWDRKLRSEHCKVIDARWRTSWRRRTPALRWDHVTFPPWPAGISPRGDMLIHFTRASAGPWPGESAASYYAALARSQRGDPRSALATLTRILDEQLVRGSPTRIRGGAQATCWTALPPHQTSPLFRWRTRYARPAFEPFAIAISTDVARQLGARPVVYDQGAVRSGRPTDALWHQGCSQRSNWLHEREWRIPGDLDLRPLRTTDAVVLVPTESAASALREHSRFPVLTATSVNQEP